MSRVGACSGDGPLVVAVAVAVAGEGFSDFTPASSLVVVGSSVLPVVVTTPCSLVPEAATLPVDPSSHATLERVS